MADRWTPQQLQAIEARDTGIIVSAAAGSGKTSVLVERLLRQVASTSPKIPADRFVVVTFTNDAAAEMKQRLTLALSKLIEREPENAWLSEQQALIQTAKISTIHSFCFDLIRENIQSLEISSGFRIMDETEEKVIVAKALENAFENFYKHKSEEMAELVDFFCTKGDKPLEGTLLNLYRFVLSIPFYQDWLEEQILRYASPDGQRLWFEEYTGFLVKKLRQLSEEASMAAVLADEISAQEAVFLLQKEAEGFRGLAQSLTDCSQAWDTRAEGFEGIGFDRIRFPKMEAESPEAELAERIKKLRTRYKEQFKKLSEESVFSAEEMRADLGRHERILTHLVDLLKVFAGEVWKYKVTKNAIGFSDAEQLAVQLLASRENGAFVKTPLAQELSDYYQVIMIDEFQDVNSTQDLIFKMLSHGGTAEQGGDNIFAVGDVKQSIYSFRQSNPAVFIKTLHTSEPYAEDFSGKNAAILLNRNFRSSHEVVDFVNFVFSRIMSRTVGEIDYTEEEKLVQSADYDEGTDRDTEILLVPTKDSEEEDDDDEAVGEEAKYVAAKIHELLSKGHPVWDKGHRRPCRSRDFCILLRNKSTGLLFAKALERYGIKAHNDEVEGYLKSREISVLLNILQVIDNPLLDIPLVSVLMSPMFLFSAEELVKIRLASPDGSMYKALCTAIGKSFFDTQEVAVSAEMDPLLFEKAVRFDKTLEQLRFCASGYNLEKLIRTIYDHTDFMSVMQIFKDGEQKKANLRLLLEYAKSYEQGMNGGLSGFIRYIQTISRQGGDFKQAGRLSGADDIVSIKTIHKSKGLEFPFVFLCRASGQFNLQDLNAQMQLHLTGGIGFKIQEKQTLKRYNSLPFIAIREKNAMSTVSEEMRLLYVALTRAREKLFITLDISPKAVEKMFGFALEIKHSGGIAPLLAAKAKCMQDWLLMALLLHPDCGELRALAGVEMIPEPAEFRVRVEKGEDFRLPEVQTESQRQTAHADPQKVSKLREWAAFSYDFTLSALPSKLTVSEISKDSAHEISLRRPAFVTERKSLTGAEKGVATHTFMQYADYAAAHSSVEDELNRLAGQGYLTEKQKNAVDVQKLKAFFASPLYGRIEKALRVERERKFLLKIADLGMGDTLTEEYQNTDGMIQGIADCLFEEADGLVLVDYKTDYVQTEEELAEMYSRQLALYRYALDRLYSKKIKEICLYSFSLGRTVLLWQT